MRKLGLPIRLARVISWLPLPRGKRVIGDILFRYARPASGSRIVQARNGLIFDVNWTDPMFRDLVVQGVYEPEVAAVARRLIRPGDCAVDVGANFGWYTCLFGRLVGPGGRVLSFEPAAQRFTQLSAAVAANSLVSVVEIHQMALGDSPGTGTIYTFEGLTQGHSSLSSLGRSDAHAELCRVTTLDALVAERKIEHVELIKCDVEGSERAVLRGARRVLSECRPAIILECNPSTAAQFGYTPETMLDELRTLDYDVHAVGRRGRLHLVQKGEPFAGNVLCLPRG